MDSACALVANEQGITLVSRILCVSRAQLTQRMKTSGNKPNKRRRRCDEAADAEVLARILDIISAMPTYGYRRVWVILRRQSRNKGLPFENAKRVYRIMSDNNLLLLHDKPSRPQREHKGQISVKESNQRWCSDGFEFCCDDGEKQRVTFALDCCDREAIDWAAGTRGYDKATEQDVMSGAIEECFGDRLERLIQWLTDNCSAYTAHETRLFARELNLEPCTTAVSSHQNNGMAERFVKTMKENHIAFIPKPNVRAALHNLAVAIEHYNEKHQHSALGYLSSREYRRQ